MITSDTTQSIPIPFHPYISKTMEIDTNAVLPVDLMEYLIKEKNPCNRLLSETHIKQYATAILNKQWDYKAGNSIRFDINGNLLDGQHRISAHIKLDNNLTPFYLTFSERPDILLL